MNSSHGRTEPSRLVAVFVALSVTLFVWLVIAPRACADEATMERFEAELSALRARVEAQDAELRQLRAAADETWMNESRAAEVEAIVRDVLSAAEKQDASSSGPTAGYNNGFFIGSGDGNFLLRVNVEGQVRYVYSAAEQPNGTDGDENGFVMRRARLDLRGHAIDPDLTYRLRLSMDRADGRALLELAYLGYAFADGWNVNIGQIKPMFAREENVNPFRQLAVERSYAADYYTVDFTQGLEVSYSGDALRGFFSIHDGSYAANSDFNADRTNFAATGRVEYRLAGTWKQFDDFTSWSGDKFGLLLGAAVDYELGEEGSGTHTPDILKYTADVSAEFGGANLFAALYGQHLCDNGSAGAGGLPTNLAANQFGLVVQGGAFIVPDKVEPFVRYEWMTFDGVYYRNNGAGTQTGTGNVADDDLSIITAGVNYYIRKHNIKFTLDGMYALDPVPVANSGAGLLRSSGEQFVLRAQMQWAF